ncbi:MAG: hypothetical protein WAM28_00485 [Chlamydiales bacterium]
MNLAGMIFLYALIPMAVAIAGGLIASFYIPKPNILNALQHFISGIVVGAVSVELLPKILEHRSWGLLLAFLVGMAFMLVLKVLTQSLAQKKTPTGLIVGGGLDLFIDGLLIGISFLAGTKSGILIIFSLCFCAFFLNLTISSTLAQNKKVQWVAIFFVAAMLPIGAFLAATVLSHLPSSFLIETITFGVAALLYLGVEELLAEGHKKEEATWITASFFIGFFVILCFKIVDAA